MAFRTNKQPDYSCWLTTSVASVVLDLEFVNVEPGFFCNDSLSENTLCRHGLHDFFGGVVDSGCHDAVPALVFRLVQALIHKLQKVSE